MPITAEILASRMIAKWEQQRQAQETSSLQPQQRPVITVSREAGGQRPLAIAQLVALRLNFEVYEKQLVEKISAAAHVAEQVVRSLDDRVQDRISEFIHSQFQTGSLTNSDYLRHLSKIVLALGEHGSAVIVGRAAHLLLGPARALRVRFVAPLERRIAETAKDYSLSERDARQVVLTLDSERAAYCKHHFKQEIADVAHYDLVLNYAVLSLELCVELILQAYAGRFPASGTGG